MFKVEISDNEANAFKQLRVPAWFWNSYEWGSFLIASGKTQKPILRQALRDLKNGGVSKTDDELMVFKRQLSSSINLFENQLRNTNSFKAFPGTKNTYGLINSLLRTLMIMLASLTANMILKYKLLHRCLRK